MDEAQREDDVDLGGGGAPEEDIFKDVPSDPTGESEAEPVPEGKLGGTGETLEELEPEAAAEEEPEPAAAEEPEPAADEEPEPSPAAAEPEPEPAASAAAPAETETKKAGTAEREYVVLLQKGEDWTEPTEPIKAGNGEAALRAAYAKLVPEGDESLTLVVVPKHFFNVKTVKAKVKSDRAIEIA